jgi:hypothetical protein
MAMEAKTKVSESVITDLKKLRGSVNMLSGDDTYLKNVWEEYCVDQQQGTNFGEVYLQTVEAHIESYLEKCTQHERMLLYLTTGSAERRMEVLDAEADATDSTLLAIDLQAVIDLIRWDIEEAAKEFTNENIERSIYGETDEEEDEEDELNTEGSPDNYEPTTQFPNAVQSTPDNFTQVNPIQIQLKT